MKRAGGPASRPRSSAPEHTGGHEMAALELGGDHELVGLLLNSTGEGIYGIDPKGNCTFANPACLALLGFESDTELLGKNMHALVHHTRPNGEPYPVEECRIYQALVECSGTHVDDECMWRSDGTDFLAEYWSYPVMRDGEQVGCVVTFVDISERRAVEEELRRSEELVRLILNSTGEGIYGIDHDGNCTFANPACLTLLGFESDVELLGKNMHSLVHHTRPNGEPYPVEECRIYQALVECSGTHVDDECMWRSDGTDFPAEYWSYPVMRDGDQMGCVVTFVDIAERRRVEEELRQSEKMAAVGKLSAGLSHELNNPAAAAGRASSQLLEAFKDLQSATVDLSRTGADPTLWDSLVEWDTELRARSGDRIELSPLEASDREEELQDWLDSHDVADGWTLASALVSAGIREDDLDRIATALPDNALREAIRWFCRTLTVQQLTTAVLESSRSISALVDAMKSYSLMDQDPVQNVDVHQGIEDTITVFGSRLEQGIEVRRKYDRDLPGIQVRAGELNQVWMNLIDNAIDALGERGTITVRTSREGDDLKVEIADDGPGIPQDVQTRVFDPFFTTKAVGQGVGLGLDVVQRIVRTRFNGRVGFRSQPGDTVFWVHLPVFSGHRD